MQPAFEDILRNPAIWRVGQVAQGTYQGVSTGYSTLDQALPEGGWPAGALTELLVHETGTGELSLLTPALRAVCAQGKGIALVAPPYLPHARAWDTAGIPLDRLLVIDAEGAELLWSAEQILRSGECGTVLVWAKAAGRALDYRALQRLHLAAAKGDALCIVYRTAGAQATPSPAPLRLKLEAQGGALQVQIIKCRGALRAKPIPIQPFPAHWDAPSAPTPSASPRIAATPLRLRAHAKTPAV
jgi:protein ImuA